MTRSKIILSILTAAALLLCCAAQAETAAAPIGGEELEAFAEQIRSLAAAGAAREIPEEESEDGYAISYDFGVIYADQPAWTDETRMNAALVMDADIQGPRGIRIDWDVNQVMEAVPCADPGMRGSRQEAVLYLEGDPESGFTYGRVERDGQRISAMEFGAADPEKGTRLALNLGISGDGVSSIRLEGLNSAFSPEESAELYGELQEMNGRGDYVRVPRSLDGSKLEMFGEADLVFPALDYVNAQPGMLGEYVEDVLIDNEDGTWLRRVDGDGFEAVFTCGSKGENARLVSYAILSPELEGPRCVRLGDLFHEDFTRFRSGEGSLDESGTREILYGTEGQAPWGAAEYGDGTEMALRYVTRTERGEDVELMLRYRDTVLEEIILHTLEKDEQ